MGRFLERGGNFIDTANVYTKGPLRKDHRRLHRPRPRAARPRRHRDEVLRQSSSRRSERRRRGPQEHRRLVRTVAAAAADRLHRPVLDALLGSLHADRRDDESARRSRGVGQGALHRAVGYAGVEGRAGADDRALPRLGAARRPADRVLAARADGRGRADPDGARDGARRHAVVAAQERCALGQVHAREFGDGESRSRRARHHIAQRARVRDHRRAAGDWEGAAGDAGGRCAGVGAGAAGRRVDDHRRAPARSARTEPRGARHHAESGAGRAARHVVEADAQLSDAVPQRGEHVRPRRRDGERRSVDGGRWRRRRTPSGIRRDSGFGRGLSPACSGFPE